MEKSKSILIVAGEASGDQHAAYLVKEIKRLDANVVFWGLGGDRLAAEGIPVRTDLVSLAVIGFSEVLKHLSTIRAVYKQLLSDIDRKKPDIAILVDYPGFNLQLAKELKKRAIPVIYYVSPQVWAWGKGRVKTIRDTVSRMIVFFPFEETLYRQNRIPVSFVGHPSLDQVRPGKTAQEFRSIFSLDPSKRTIGLLPGSRQKEVKTLLPVMLETARLISQDCASRVQFIVLAAPSVPADMISSIVKEHGVPVTIVNNMTYDGIAASDFCLVCSGTATLETGILGTPMVILYKVNFLTWLYLRLLIKIPYIGLVNVVAGKKISEEFIQYDAQPRAIASYCKAVLTNTTRLASLRKDLETMKRALGDKGASARAAQAVMEFLR
ncbi:MAG: lipid-A-disaccharide synthase [Candidatus Omnitrophota bacterium]